MDYRIISIGALSCHELWNETAPSRTAHATTTLVRSGDRVILVDPALPPQVIAARLQERAGLATEAITDVFLTNFRPAHRMGLAAFEQARWLIGEAEREAIGARLVEQYKQIEADGDDQTRQMLESDIALLKRCQPAPDQLAEHVDLFPLPGFTPGTCGLLLSHPNRTTLIASDAVATAEHLEQGRVLRGAFDAEQARESFMEAIEIADVLIPGHDNVLMNPMRRPF
jgi:glyoxylase-like metal-dependent hydrolase (beta-lactamase superfamily II)